MAGQVELQIAEVEHGVGRPPAAPPQGGPDPGQQFPLLNGLVMQSSAPRSRPITRSVSPDRPLITITGVSHRFVTSMRQTVTATVESLGYRVDQSP